MWPFNRPMSPVEVAREFRRKGAEEHRQRIEAARRSLAEADAQLQALLQADDKRRAS